MSSRANKTILVSPIDHVIRHSLRRQVERQNPVVDTKHQLLQRAAERSLLKRLALLVYGTEPETYFAPQGTVDITLGWRELAQVLALRPACVFGGLSGLLR
ncbi:MAG: hypothetical protein ACT4QE_26650 [Anaerolineales bacterium]